MVREKLKIQNNRVFIKSVHKMILNIVSSAV